MSGTPIRALARFTLILAIVYGTFCACAVSAQGNAQQRAGKFSVELRIPPDGIYSGEEIDLEFRLTDSTNEDPVLGGSPVLKALVSAEISMPAMPSMPRQKPKTHAEGVPGDYGVVAYFPHGGDYLLDLRISPPNDKAFTVTFKLPVRDTEIGGKRKPRAQPFVLEVVSSPSAPRAGERTDLEIRVLHRDTKQPVTDFETVHEKLIHFVIVTKDLASFSHEHPVIGIDGRFTLSYTFPAGGEYRLFADTAPRGAGSQVLMQTVKVAGTPAPNHVSVFATNARIDPVAGVSLKMVTDQSNLIAGKMQPLAFELVEERSGAPITNIQNWLGAVAHLIFIHQDASTFVHCHPDETDPANGKSGKLTFLARLPRPGIYRGWLQFQRGGQVNTAAFTIEAKVAK